MEASLGIYVAIPIPLINIAAVERNLLEARMRGYKKGTFTGATKDTEGWFERANGGVLFLDEFQSAPRHVQTSLLDLLSAVSNEVRIERLGEEGTPLSLDVQVFLAINEDIRTLQQSRRLRGDFVHRMGQVVPFPSLSEILSKGTEAGASLEERIRHLYYQICWCSVPLVPTLEDPEHYFPRFTTEMFRWIKDTAWEGNYREFERVLVEALLESQHIGKLIDQDRVETVYARRRKALGFMDSTEGVPPSPPLQKKVRAQLDAVIEIFRAHGCVIYNNPGLAKLAEHRLKDRATLKRFVLNYQKYFPEDIRANLDFQNTIQSTHRKAN